jgi:hypothetical protein
MAQAIFEEIRRCEAVSLRRPDSIGKIATLGRSAQQMDRVKGGG